MIDRAQQDREYTAWWNAEHYVIGSILRDPESFWKVADRLRPEHFVTGHLRVTWLALCYFFQTKKIKEPDIFMLAEYFGEHPNSDAPTLGEMIGWQKDQPSSAGIAAHAEVMVKYHDLSKLRIAGADIACLTGDDAYTQAAKLIGACAPAKAQGGVTGKDGLKRTAIELKRRMDAGGSLLGIPTSLEELDDAINGLQDTDLIIIAARPSMGKTALMLQLNRQAAKLGRRPFTISMEMSAEQVYMRQIAATGRIDFKHVQNPTLLEEEETARLQSSFAELNDYEWWLDDASSLTVEQIAARIRRMKMENDIGIAFIDYLQFIDLGTSEKNTATAIQHVTRTLKGLAKELRIPIVLLSQLNRALETRADKRPIMSDLRESGAIEQDADVIIFLHREAYYLGKDWEPDDPRHNIAEVIIGKARNGQTTTIKALWFGRFQQFQNLSRENVPQEYRDIEERRNERSSGKPRGFDPHRDNRLRTKGPSGGRPYQD